MAEQVSREEVGVAGAAEFDAGVTQEKGAAGVDTPPDIVHPLVGNAFDAMLTLRHEGEKPDGMTFAGSAMASGFAAAAVSERERAGRQAVSYTHLTLPTIYSV